MSSIQLKTFASQRRAEPSSLVSIVTWRLCSRSRRTDLLVRMPSRAGRDARDVASSLRTQRGGAGGASLQSAEAPERGGMRVHRASQAAPLEYGDTFGWCMAAGTG